MFHLVLFAIFTTKAHSPLKKIDKHVRPLLEFDIASKFEMISGKQKHESLYEAAPLFQNQRCPLSEYEDEFIVRNKQTKTNFIYPRAKTLPDRLHCHFKTLMKKIDSLSEWTIAIDNDGLGNFMIVAQNKLTNLTFKRTTGAEKILNKLVPNDDTDSEEFDVIISKVRSVRPSIEGLSSFYLADNIMTMLLQNGAEIIFEANIREDGFLKRYSHTKTAAYLIKNCKDPDTLSYIKELEKEKVEKEIEKEKEKIAYQIRSQTCSNCEKKCEKLQLREKNFVLNSSKSSELSTQICFECDIYREWRFESRDTNTFKACELSNQTGFECDICREWRFLSLEPDCGHEICAACFINILDQEGLNNTCRFCRKALSDNLDDYKTYYHKLSDLKPEEYLAAALIAAQHDKIYIFKFLAEKKTNLDLKMKNGTTPVCVAAAEGHKEIVKFLVKNKVDLNQPMPNGATPVWMAAVRGHSDIVKILARAKVDLNRADLDGCTPVLIAVDAGHIEIVKFLAEQKVDLNRADDNGCTPVFIAVQNHHEKIVKFLIFETDVKLPYFLMVKRVVKMTAEFLKLNIIRILLIGFVLLVLLIFKKNPII